MGLVDYSDSDTSDVEEATKPISKPSATLSKLAFQKVVDRSNPGKIRVALPQAALQDETKSEEPPAKKLKSGGGAFSGFNSFLPAPKRTGQNATTLGGGTGKKGLGAGVNLKTGATPGFSRELEPERENAEDTNESLEVGNSANTELGLNLPLPRAGQIGEQGSAEEVKLVGKPLMFRPLSVARKPAKKKKQIPGATASVVASPALLAPVTPQFDKPSQRPKVSLFSMATEPTSSAVSQSTGEYQPILFNTDEAQQKVDEGQDGFDLSYEDYTPTTSHMVPPAVPTPPISQSLDDIAGDLNLSAAERRQLFGRQKGGQGMQAVTKIINFNTDEEYLRNEEARASGEQVVHNPVRALAPGKHSLKQLVNAAQNQKEALEESFAQGKANRAEASSRYGW